jgi:two-component system OmpR family response regulator
LDLGLPDMSGLEVCTQLRKRDIQSPVLVLSGSRDSNTKVSLFEAGADDYLTKPFTMAELRARLFALLRRTNFDNNHKQDLYLLRVGNLTLDPLSGRVERSGKLIKLRRKEFGILEYLMRNKDKIVTRSMIMDNVWEPDCSSWDGTVNVHIKRLRDQIDRPYGQKLIKTAYGLGYTISDKS